MAIRLASRMSILWTQLVYTSSCTGLNPLGNQACIQPLGTLGIHKAFQPDHPDGWSGWSWREP